MASSKTGTARTYFLATIGLLASLHLTGCSGVKEDDKMMELRGLVTYREKMALPGTARLEVELQDRTRPVPEPIIIGRTVVEHAGQIPIGFKITFNTAMFNQGHIYSVTASIYDGDRVLFTTPDPQGVDLENSDGLLEIVLMKAN